MDPAMIAAASATLGVTNMRPAGDLAASMGFTNVKLLMIDTNFGADWVSKGYPTERTR